MSDYLNNLVNRTFGLAPLVQPRLASVFEPPAVATTNHSDVSVESETIIEATTPAPLSAAFSSQTITSETQNLRETAARQKEEPAEKNSLPSARETLTSSVFQAAPQIPVAARPPEQVHARTFPQERTDPQTPPNPERPESGARSETTPKLITMSEPSDRDSWPRIEPRVKKLIDAQLTNVPSPATERERVDQVTATQPNLPVLARDASSVDASAVARSQHFASRFALPLAPPETINVTIGRVDVRANFSQAPARPARLQTPATNSLDDYLKQRSEGRK
jgi:hypothetical protein